MKRGMSKKGGHMATTGSHPTKAPSKIMSGKSVDANATRSGTAKTPRTLGPRSA